LSSSAPLLLPGVSIDDSGETALLDDT